MIVMVSMAASVAADQSAAEARRAERVREYLRTTHLANISDTSTQLRLEDTFPGVGLTRYQYRQMYRGVPVTSGMLELESGDDGRVRVALDRTVPDLDVDVATVVSADAAQRKATSTLGINGVPKYNTELFVYPKDRENDHTRLVWVVNVTEGDDSDDPVNASVWVDANSGVVVKSYHGVRYSAEKSHIDAATKTFTRYSAWLKTQFIGDDSDEWVLKTSSKSAAWSMQDPCHGIFGNGSCPGTVDGVPGDSYYDCRQAASCKKRTLFTTGIQQYYVGVLRVPFGNYLHDNSDPATAAADIWVAMKWIRLFMTDYMSQPTIEGNDAPINVLVNENDPSTAAGGASYNLTPLPPSPAKTYSIISQIGGTAPNGVPMTTGSAPDVIAHEIGHAIQWQQYLKLGGTSAANEPLQEAQADMFAAAFDSYFTRATSKPIKPWWIGEQECLINYAGNQFTTPTVAIRYMDHPSLDAYLSGSQFVSSPDCYGSSVPALPAHFASGPYNHMFYVLATGDLMHTCNQNVVLSGIGWDTAFQLWRVVIKNENPTDNYANVRQLWVSAASGLFGASSDVTSAVNAACDAVLIP
jgi:Zn-dependent metalloprotease